MLLHVYNTGVNTWKGDLRQLALAAMNSLHVQDIHIGSLLTIDGYNLHFIQLLGHGCQDTVRLLPGYTIPSSVSVHSHQFHPLFSCTGVINFVTKHGDQTTANQLLSSTFFEYLTLCNQPLECIMF